MLTRGSAITLAILSSVLSSTAWLFQGAAVASLTPIAVAAAQGLLAGLIYLAHTFATGGKLPMGLVKLRWKELASFTLLRSVLGSVLVCYAISLSDSIKVMFFTKLEPYFVLFWCWLLLGQTISRGHALLLVIHVGGAVLLSTGGRLALAQSQWGDALLIVAVGILAYSYLQARELARELGPIHTNGLSALISGICLLPAAVLLSPASTWNFFTIGWLHVVILVLLFNVLALTMWYTSLPHIEGWLVSALRATGPVAAAPVAWLFFDQSLSTVQLLGAAIVLITSAMLAREQRGRPAGKRAAAQPLESVAAETL